jgi:hypothetical protein
MIILHLFDTKNDAFMHERKFSYFVIAMKQTKTTIANKKRTLYDKFTTS